MMSAVAEGWTDAQIAAYFGTSKATARAYITVYHEKPKEAVKAEPHTNFEELAGMIVSKPRGFYSDEKERSFIVRAYIAGHSMEKIARSL